MAAPPTVPSKRRNKMADSQESGETKPSPALWGGLWMAFLVSLGEAMLRYSPPRSQRLRAATSLNIHLCGAQFNVAANLAFLGKSTIFLSKLPENELGQLARSAGMHCGIDMSYVRMVPDSRIGTVYVEFGAEPRANIHFYDRKNSAASEISPADFPWKEILKDSQLAYTDGIFPGLSQNCRETTLEFIRVAREVGATVCFDMNYRAAIWTPEEAEHTYRQILPSVDILVTNHAVSQIVFGFHGSDEEVARRYPSEFGCSIVCITSREMIGNHRGRWKSLALDKNEFVYGRPFEFEVVDRFGTGDAFFSGFLYGYSERNAQFALDFGNAFCALAHTVEGDVVPVSVHEVMALLDGPANTHIRR
jgi:2-dehydro-3-deoxygluconokinase